jgi:hypothetical protein
MSYLVFDIETTGKNYDELDETTKGYFRQWAERDAQTDAQVEREMEQIKKGLPFSIAESRRLSSGSPWE